MACSTPSRPTTRTGSPGCSCGSNGPFPHHGCGEAGPATPGVIPFPQALIEVAHELSPEGRCWAEETARKWF